MQSLFTCWIRDGKGRFQREHAHDIYINGGDDDDNSDVEVLEKPKLPNRQEAPVASLILALQNYINNPEVIK